MRAASSHNRRDERGRGAVKNASDVRFCGWARILVMATTWGAANAAFAWIYPEHRDIAVLAVQGLDAERSAEFDRLWQAARAGDEQRMCAMGADTGQGVTPACIDWAALSAIGGDHSCSSADMLETVRKSDWILVVADVAAQLKADLARIPVTAPPDQAEPASRIIADAQRRLADEASRAMRLNALRSADTRMQRADAQYARRADANLAHFLLPRPDTNLDPIAYAILAVKPGSELNAIGVYAWYHISAMEKASRLANERLSPEERRALVRAMLFDEAFALHFLEDVFAAGHVAGSWGDVSQRKGTHDFYNQNGIEVFTWKGRERTIVLMGDAHMRPQDAALAAESVRKSIAQVLDAAAGRSRGYSIPHAATAAAKPDDFDICKTATFPDRGVGLGTGRGQYAQVFEEVVLDTPVPALGPGLGALPRARSEVGVFMGLAASITGRAVERRLRSLAERKRLHCRARPRVSRRIGTGGGVGGRGGWTRLSPGRLDRRWGLHEQVLRNGTGNARREPERRDPGALGPVDADPDALLPHSRRPLVAVADVLLQPGEVHAARRHAPLTAVLFGWQQGWATPIGRFQFVLGRELGVTFYGLWGEPQLLAPPVPPATVGRVVNFKSTYFDLPILEYRPYRAFSANQSSTVLFQLFAGADVPYGASVEAPIGAPPPSLRTVWSVGVRMTFDWRYYWK